MPAYKDAKKGTWYSKFRYKNWKNETKDITKRGFATKRDALKWESEFKKIKAGSLEMSFEEFIRVYEQDRKARLKESTWETKKNIIESKLIPAFGKMKLQDIIATDIIKWQNELIEFRDDNGKAYSPVYLKTVHNQISAVFNHAVRFYHLNDNPARKAGSMGSERGAEMSFWTEKEYLLFAEATMEYPLAYYCFEVLYWCGIREGELLALTWEDIDFEKRELSINKTFQHLKGRDIVTNPKTPKSIRRIVMPEFLCEELQDYKKASYDVKPKDRVFPVSKSFLTNRMARATQQQGLKKIRIHDLRHSHVSLLINMGYSAVAIAERMGHEAIDITYRYAHLFPTVQNQMAEQLDKLREDNNNDSKE